jgi:hypothetical protein
MTNRFRRGGRGQQPQNMPMPPVIQCPSCGMLNDPNARFCRNCGLPLGWPQDPVRGTMMRQADLPSERGAGIASIVGLIAAVAILGAAGYLVLRGTNGGGATTPTPPPAATATVTPSQVAIGSGSPSPTASRTPVVTPSPTATVAVSSPTATASTPGSTPPPAVRAFSCDPVTIGNSVKGHWTITRANWRFTDDKYDTIELVMGRTRSTGGLPTMTLESMESNEVATRFGLTPPSGVDHALVLTLGKQFSSVRISPHQTSLPSVGLTAMKAVPTFQVQPGTDDLWHVVLGVVGEGCARVGVPEWVKDPTATDGNIQIDVQH